MEMSHNYLLKKKKKNIKSEIRNVFRNALNTCEDNPENSCGALVKEDISGKCFPDFVGVAKTVTCDASRLRLESSLSYDM